ncbi:MAG: iron-containing alcohol dehydrogenase [Clostridiales bacterium]|nr:iron-containing alcohol dehydrogenase [Clostridiales bacterium]
MAGSKKIVKYAIQTDIGTQSLFLEEDSRLRLVNELKNRGTRRILVICNNPIRKLRPFDELIDHLNNEGFRTFIFCQTENLLMDRDIEGGLKIYGEYNCDTIITIGGSPEIDCGKLIAACSANPVKSLTQIVGIDKLPNPIPLLCTIMTENCASSTTASAEFYDNDASKWRTVISSNLVPQIVVIDTDFSERVSFDNTISSALTALCVTIEAYISPVARLFPEYRASSVNATTILFRNLEKFTKNKTDTFIRKQIAVGGFYSGLSTRKVGIGYAHIIMHTLLCKYNIVHGTGLTGILILVLKEQVSDPKTCEGLAELAKALHFCSNTLPDDKAAESFIFNLERLYGKVSNEEKQSLVDSKDIDYLINEIEKEAKMYALSRHIDTKALRRILAALT